MEKRFWLITLMFFMAVAVCFLLIVSEHLTEAISPAVASTDNGQGMGEVPLGQLQPRDSGDQPAVQGLEALKP
jgi:hypothetical protein